MQEEPLTLRSQFTVILQFPHTHNEGDQRGLTTREIFFLFFNGFPAPTDLVGVRCRSCQFSFALIKTVGMLKMLTADSFSLQIC